MISSLRLRFRYLLLRIQAMTLLAFGRRAQALCQFGRMLQLFPRDRYVLSSHAHVLVQLNRLDESIASLRQLTGLNGSQAQQAVAWFNLGYVLQQAGRHPDASAAFEQAIEYDPSLDQAWYGLGLVLIDQGRLDEARQALKKNTALQPMSPYGWYRLAEVYRALDEPEKASQIIDHLRQFEPRVAAQLEREISRGGAWHGAEHRSLASKAGHATH